MVKKVRSKFEQMNNELKKQENYKEFFFSKDCNLFGFATKDQISAAQNTMFHYDQLVEKARK